MIRRAATPRARSGITLTEILISILIMGVGVISLATLFPLGLMRLRNASRMTRGSFLAESAVSDLGTRNLLAQGSFLGLPAIAQCYVTTSGQYNPWLQDTPSYGADWNTAPFGVTRTIGPGLPVAYDPLWRAACNGSGLYLPPLTAAGNNPPEARFGQGVWAGGAGFVRTDPDGNPASAHGLQRLTNMPPAFNAVVYQTFVSPEDYILQDPKGAYQDPNAAAGTRLTGVSPVVPDMTNGVPDNEWRYSWLFTGQQSDAANGTVFDGDVVVCENRAFGIDAVTSPFGGTAYQVTGETVVEAVWGFSAAPDTRYNPTGNYAPYGSPSARRTVLLRWPSSMPDPDVKVGGWIADVTYERNATVQNTGTRWANLGGTSPPTSSLYPAQRCYWYQIAKRTDPTVDTLGLGGQTYRQMTVWTTTPLRAMTPMNYGPPATPAHVEAALIMPSVVNVYPRTVYTR
jgi:hypothetical protein